jgi:hypothetical protein
MSLINDATTDTIPSPPSLPQPPPRVRYEGYSTASEAPIKVERERMLQLVYNELNPEQQHCFTLILKGNSTFLTGYPGVGKTFLLSGILEACRLQAPTLQVAITGTYYPLS